MCQGELSLAEVRSALAKLQTLAEELERSTRQYHDQALELQRALAQVEQGLADTPVIVMNKIPLIQSGEWQRERERSDQT